MTEQFTPILKCEQCATFPTQTIPYGHQMHGLLYVCEACVDELDKEHLAAKEVTTNGN